jgi:hypothetical protein
VTTSRILVTLAAGVLTMGSPRLAGAQAAPAGKPVPQARAEPAPEAREPVTEKKGTSTSRPKRVLRLEELKVEGRIQKPQAMFLMPRANLNYAELDRGESFVSRIPEALGHEPF